MAESLTVNTDPSTETVVDNLTPEEQESLAVGEEMAQQQDQLLAGKYKNAEELEKAYVELQSKLGEKNSEDSEATGESEDSDEGGEETEETTETKEASPAVALITEASDEFYKNEGKLSPETMEKFNTMSSSDLLAAYMEVQKNNPQAQAQAAQTPDLTSADVNVIKNTAGGETEYKNLMDWSKQNLEKSEIQDFNALVGTGNLGAIKMAVNGLKSRYENANGYEGRMLSGKAPRTSGDVFRSQAEVVQAMNDPKYDQDPAYRQDIMEKLDRSNLQFQVLAADPKDRPRPLRTFTL